MKLRIWIVPALVAWMLMWFYVGQSRAQQPGPLPSPSEMQAIAQAIAKQRDSAQGLHAQCEADAVGTKERLAAAQSQMQAIMAELKALKDKHEPKPPIPPVEKKE